MLHMRADATVDEIMTELEEISEMSPVPTHYYLVFSVQNRKLASPLHSGVCDSKKFSFK
ncbi:hypothetical protein DPMN_119897 [Dreissena polymorpha]|uniref:Uncharacterized protein n=1 Tax=Dreissena polymorpha TaxID=45954 RepID=A0A9D4GMR1_DREPO|nr:hypothetical protein DPMN_119897 [Dreissena polymorpha]